MPATSSAISLSLNTLCLPRCRMSPPYEFKRIGKVLAIRAIAFNDKTFIDACVPLIPSIHSVAELFSIDLASKKIIIPCHVILFHSNLWRSKNTAIY